MSRSRAATARPASAARVGANLVPTTMDEQAAARAEEVVALPAELRIGHDGIRERHDEFRVLPGHHDRVRRLLVIGIVEVHVLRSRAREQRPDVLRVQIPQRDVRQVHAPIGDEAAAVIPPAAPPGLPALLVGVPRRGPLKQVPIEAGRRLRLRLRRPAVPVSAVHENGVRDRAELAGLDDLRGLLEMLPRALLRPDLWVAEIVYFPLETALLRAARALGCRTVDGGGMAIFQGTEAFRLFTGISPDPDIFFATFASLGG